MLRSKKKMSIKFPERIKFNWNLTIPMDSFREITVEDIKSLLAGNKEMFDEVEKYVEEKKLNES